MFPEGRVTRKIFNRAAADFFFLIIFQGYSLFFFSFFYFFWLLLFWLFAVSWKKKCVFWYTFDYAGGWVINIFSPDRFLETRLLYFGLIVKHEKHFPREIKHNVVERLFSNPFLKNQNSVYLWINTQLLFLFIKEVFIVRQAGGLSKGTEN